MENRPRCIATVRINSSESDACAQPAVKGGQRCKQHEAEYKRKFKRRRYKYALKIQEKPKREKPLYYGRLFDTFDEAQDFVRLSWGQIIGRPKGRHFHSLSYERILTPKG